MTQRHFIALAARIARITDPKARKIAAEAVADVCGDFNPRFDRWRFLAACNVD